MNEIKNVDCMSYMGVVADNSFELLLTDIPYGGVNRKSNGLRNLDKKDADTFDMDLEQLVKEMVRVTKGSGYIFCGWEQISTIISVIRDLGISNRLCTWRKTNPSPMNGQSIWLSGAEYCVYFKKPKATFNEHCKNCVWDFPSGRGKVHPTEKPLKLFEYLLKASSNENDIVFDPFAGSGTTAVAAQNNNRNYIVCEINPEYIEIIKNRVTPASQDKE